MILQKEGRLQGAQHNYYITVGFTLSIHIFSNFLQLLSVILRIAKRKKLCYLIDTRKKQTTSSTTKGRPRQW